MEKWIKKFIEYPYLVFILMVKELYSLAISLIDSITKIDFAYKYNLDTFDFLLKLVMAFSLWMVLKAYKRMKDEFENFSIVEKLATSYRSYKQYRGNWHGEEKFIYDTMVFPQMQAEKNFVRQRLLEKFKNSKTPHEIEIMIEEYYKVN